MEQQERMVVGGISLGASRGRLRPVYSMSYGHARRRRHQAGGKSAKQYLLPPSCSTHCCTSAAPRPHVGLGRIACRYDGLRGDREEPPAPPASQRAVSTSPIQHVPIVASGRHSWRSGLESSKAVFLRTASPIATGEDRERFGKSQASMHA